MAFLMSYFASKKKAAPSPSQAAAKKTLSQLGIDDAAVPQASTSWSKLQMPVSNELDRDTTKHTQTQHTAHRHSTQTQHTDGP